MEKYAVPKSTQDQQKKHSERFYDFLKSKFLSTNLVSLTAERLNEYLKYFYSELKTADGRFYSPASLSCIRAALLRHFSSLRIKYNILNDIEFKGSNLVIKAMAKRFFEQGGSVKQYDSIEELDMLKLRSYFDRSTPEKLQEEVYFAIEYYLGTRGREWIRYFKKENLLFQQDSSGNEYVEIEGEFYLTMFIGSQNIKYSLTYFSLIF